MDLELVGRHALLFDDDAMVAFVNSGDALVEWHSLQIDRYDVRHLLSAPPSPRRGSRIAVPDLLDYLSIESQLDHDRYFDLPSHADQPDVEEDRRVENLGHHAVAFSYGNTDVSIDKKITDGGMESSGFLPRFAIPENLHHCLPLTEKVHQIIARTAMFVSKHGGQSEFILRVKQGNNPIFGFLMPDHQLHAYFRYLVEHPELLNAESDGSLRNDEKKADNDHTFSNSVGGALFLLGSFYGTEEDEDDGHHSIKTVKDVSQDCSSSADHSISLGSKNIPPQVDTRKDESMSRNPILSNKEKVLMVKKTTSKSGTIKCMEEKARILSADSDKVNNLTVCPTSDMGPVIFEPPTELKRLIEKLVEFIMRNGKQFEATLIEQDRKHGRFPFLLSSDKYHSYYLKALETAQESKANDKNMYSGANDMLGRRMDRKASLLKGNDSAFCDLPPESDKKEKFKMVIGKSKDTQETESKVTHQEYGVTVDAAAAAAILEAAIRGIKQGGFQPISSTPNSDVHVGCSEDGQPGNLGSHMLTQRDAIVVNSGKTDSQNGLDDNPKVSGRTATKEVDSAETPLTREQQLKAERLKRAKLFVAKLKGGETPINTGTICNSSLEPRESGVSSSTMKVNNESEGGSLSPIDEDRPATDDKAEMNYSVEEHTQRLLKRKYRLRSGTEDDDGNLTEMEKIWSRRHHKAENEDKRESSDKDGHKHFKSKHRSTYKKDKNHKRSEKKHDSDLSSKHVKKRRSSKQHPEEEECHDVLGRERNHSRKKHRENSLRGKGSQSNLRHGMSSGDHSYHSHKDRHTRESRNERNDLEEGEISSRGIANHPGRETSVGVSCDQTGIPLQPSETAAEVPDDLRAKIRAMLMATR